MILYYGGSLIRDGLISVGDLTSFFLYTAYVGGSLMGLSSFYTNIMKGLGASERIFDLLDQKAQVEGIYIYHG
jgi:putative ABC transport system ATP-binding protein